MIKQTLKVTMPSSNPLQAPLESLQSWLKTHTGRRAGLYAQADEFDEGMHPANLPSLLFFPLGASFSSAWSDSISEEDFLEASSLLAAVVHGALAIHGPDHLDVAYLEPDASASNAPRGIALLTEACGAHFFAGFWAKSEQEPGLFPPEWIPRHEPMQAFNELLPARIRDERLAGSILGERLAEITHTCPKGFASGFGMSIAQSLSFQHCHRYQTGLSVQRSLARPGSGVFFLNACLRTMCKHGIDISPAIDSGLLNTESLSRLDLPGSLSPLLLQAFRDEFDMTRSAFEAAQIRADISPSKPGSSKASASI